MINEQCHCEETRGRRGNLFYIWLKEVRIQFCTAAILPVFVGTALAWSHCHQFNLGLFILAAFSMALFQMGANVSNDYFDSLSKNDWFNNNASPYSGGSQIIQKKLLSEREVLIGSLILFASASILGFIIVIITKSIFIFLLGLIGLLGAFFYTASPIKLGYRTAGEITIGFLFGILPVYGAYYIQTGLINWIPLLPSILVAILIFLVIFANEFADHKADKAVNKNTIVVTFNIKKAAYLYKAALFFVILLSFLLIKSYILDLIIFCVCAKCFLDSDPEKLAQDGYFTLSKSTVILHTIAGASLIIAILML
jgi:1,4-dihydroxy-2-naphthoate octaprenyltransferase